jgi:hypothetical protein
MDNETSRLGVERPIYRSVRTKASFDVVLSVLLVDKGLCMGTMAFCLQSFVCLYSLDVNGEVSRSELGNLSPIRDGGMTAPSRPNTSHLYGQGLRMLWQRYRMQTSLI